MKAASIGLLSWKSIRVFLNIFGCLDDSHPDDSANEVAELLGKADGDETEGNNANTETAVVTPKDTDTLIDKVLFLCALFCLIELLCFDSKI